MTVNRSRRALRRSGRLGGPAVAVLVFSVSACGGSPASPRSAVPAEFQTACGHPGAHVMVRKVPVTVSHAACDLTGVLITYRNYAGATVPRGDGGTTIGNSSGFTLTIRSGSLDLTVDATGTPGNAWDLRTMVLAGGRHPGRYLISGRIAEPDQEVDDRPRELAGSVP